MVQMFYDLFCELCERKGVKPTRAALDMGFSNATPTKWKKTGAAPSGESLARIAEYFGVSTDYLLGKETQEVTFDDFTYAMYQQSKTLSEQQKKTLLAMAEYFRAQRAQED